MTKKEYERIFKSFPDIVTLPQFCKMLGGIGDGTARKLMQGHYVQHFVIRNTYYIPKVCVIDYVMSKHYENYSKQLKGKIERI